MILFYFKDKIHILLFDKARSKPDFYTILPLPSQHFKSNIDLLSL